MQIDCYYTHQGCPAAALGGQTVVVIDVLRATSSMITALEAGAQAIIPIAQVADALALRQQLPQAILAGERDGDRLEGFDLGNSPAEFTPANVGGRLIIACTTNGTSAIEKAAAAHAVWLAALLNRRAVAQRLLQQAPAQATILCSGTDGQPSFDDIVTAGAILAAMHEQQPFAAPELNDAAWMALRLYQDYADRDMAEVLALSRHGRRLIHFRRGSDLPLCAKLDSSSLVPHLDRASGRIMP